MSKYNVYDPKGELFKGNCTLVAIIPKGYRLSDEEVRKYFDIDEDHHLWEFNHRPWKYDRLVFDRCIVPCSGKFRIELVTEV